MSKKTTKKPTKTDRAELTIKVEALTSVLGESFELANEQQVRKALPIVAALVAALDKTVSAEAADKAKAQRDALQERFRSFAQAKLDRCVADVGGDFSRFEGDEFHAIRVLAWEADDLDAVRRLEAEQTRRAQVLEVRLATSHDICNVHGCSAAHVRLVIGSVQSTLGVLLCAEHARTLASQITSVLDARDEDERDEDKREQRGDACPGCGSLPGEGATFGCVDPLGCGYFAELEAEALAHEVERAERAAGWDPNP